MAKRYIPAWERVVRVVLENTPWDALHPDEQQAVQAFVTDKNKGDADKAEALLAQLIPKVALRKALPLAGIILLWAAALLSAPLLCFAFGTKWLAPALAVIIIVDICGAKSVRMRRLWNERKSGAEGVSAALSAMYYTTLRSPLAAAEKVRLTVAVLAMLLLVATWFLPEPAPEAAARVADKVAEVTAGKAVLADAQALLPEGVDGLEVAQRAMKYTAHGSDEEFLLAALMWMHIEDDGLLISDYATGATGPAMYEALENTVPAQIDNPEEIAALALLLKYAGAQQEAALTRFVGQKTLPDGLLAAFGSVMKEGRTLPQLLVLGDTIAAAGHDPLPFLREGVGSVTLAEGEALIASVDGDDHRRLLICAIAPAITDVNEVLAFIRLAKEQGVSAAECYPEGAVITLDTTKWDPYTSPQATSLGKRDTFLVLRRTEKAEPYTTFVVPEEAETGRSGELPSGLYEDYDPDAETGAAQYTVSLETAVLDRMPPESIPRTIADCDAVIILDCWYWCDGYVRFTRSVTEDGSWKHRQIDSPTFGMCQEIAVYNKAGSWLFSYKENAAYSPAMQEENLSSKDALDWNPADHYIAAPSDAWMTETYADFLHSLERRNWRLVP